MLFRRARAPAFVWLHFRVPHARGVSVDRLASSGDSVYAINHAVTPRQSQDFVAVSTQTADMLGHYVSANAVVGDSRDELTQYIRTKKFTASTMLALRELVNGTGTETEMYKDLKAVPQDQVRNFRNDLYVVSESIRLMRRSGTPHFSAADARS